MTLRAGPQTPSTVRRFALGLGVGTFLLYLPSLWFDFIQLDTRTVLLEHFDLYNERSLWASFRNIVFRVFPREEPLIVRDLVWAVEARIFGLHNPLGYHLGSALLNAACTSLAFLVLLRSTHNLALAGLTSALFAVLTVHVQPVCWTMGSKDLLVALFMCLSLLVNQASLEHSGTRRGRVLFLCVLLLHMLAILSKFSAVFFFLVLALQRVFSPYLDGRRAPDAPLNMKRALRDTAPILIGGGAISAVLFHWYQLNLTQYGVLVGRGPATLSAEHLHKLGQFIPWVLALNLKLLFWPFQYSIVYQHPNANIPLTKAELLTGYTTLVVLLVLVGYALRRRKDLAFYALCAGALLLPYLNIQYIGYWVADRYLYGIGLFVLAIAVQLGLDTAARFPNAKQPLMAAFAMLLVFYAVRTLQYQAMWRDELTLYRHETGLDQPSVLAWEARAKEALRTAKQSKDPAARARLLDEARGSCKRGLALYEQLAIPLTHYRASERLYASKIFIVLGDVAQAEGKPMAERIPYYEQAYALAVSAKSAIVLAQAYLELAATYPAGARQDLVRKSFLYFTAYVKQVQNDALRRFQADVMLLRNYEWRFPFLAHEIAALRARHLH